MRSGDDITNKKTLTDQCEKQIIDILVKRGNDHLNEPRGKVGFTGNPDADDLLDDLQRAGQPARSVFFASPIT